MTDSIGGRVIKDRFELEKLLGQGGMGSVWRALDRTLGSHVAIKLIDPMLAMDEGVRGRFLLEAKAAAALRSPHVVQILDYGVDEGIPFIAMELLDGESLADRLARVRVLSPTETQGILRDVGRAMTKAHDAGIVHRDLKPDNIFLVRNDDQEVAKVLDFGIAKAETPAAKASATKTGALLGTLPYMSPEQATGKRVDARADVWAMGVIAFECLTGRLPFAAEAPGQLIVEICSLERPVPSTIAAEAGVVVPQGFDALWARAADREIERRFQSARELADALAGALAAGAERAPQVPRSAPDPRPPVRATTLGRSAVATDLGVAGTRSRSRLVLGGLAAVVAAGAIAAWVVASGGGVPSGASAASSSAPRSSAPVAVGTSAAPVVPPAEAPPAPPVETAAAATASATPSSSARAPSSTRSTMPASPKPAPAPAPKKRRMD